MSENVFVLGLDPDNLETLRDVRGLNTYRFHPLLSVDELLAAEHIEFDDLLAKADQQLRAFQDPINAVVGYWDFPVSSMVPILCARFGLRSATLESVLKCEHKYWSRLEQQQVIDEHPRFGLVELDDESPPDGVRYPLWVKPVKSFSSELAFEVHDDTEFRDAMTEIRAGIGRVGQAFDTVLAYVDLPPEVADAGGQACLAEESVSGKQVTVEGYSTGDDIHVYGIIDSHTYPDSPSFLRYQYPSTLPDPVLERMARISTKVIDRIGLASVAFNIEYFWDPETDEINLLEVNPRHSQSHARLFDDVDGLPNHQCMVRLALGLDPALPHREGPYDLAAKWWARRFTDGVVRRAPTPKEVAEIERSIEGTSIHLLAQEGDRLSELPEQDSYSFAYATIHTAAADEAELSAKYDRCLEALSFEFDDAREPGSGREQENR
ncbi:ATP-grasp domain-containing protein [Amycolatopsis marina]|uniref:ATP-grasp domain-containing protein n=1 Tax=Amycolatopsis marina TaxID=490629 RepID=A0A1I1B3E3_9PSEU|nr:ATP-grasp domain-containing protein [Amycolatopsis marina]SFB44262.1 ATP-grasp domain-containing protein [Amycolatopsis marina]